jgi:hypothetical protein
MHEAGVPVIHLLNIKSLAAANDIPVGPAKLELSAERTTEPLAHAAWLGGRSRRVVIRLCAGIAEIAAGKITWPRVSTPDEMHTR